MGDGSIVRDVDVEGARTCRTTTYRTVSATTVAAEAKGSKLVDLLARAVRAGSSGGKRNNANAILVGDRTASSVATVGEKRATGSARARAREGALAELVRASRPN